MTIEQSPYEQQRRLADKNSKLVGVMAGPLHHQTRHHAQSTHHTQATAGRARRRDPPPCVARSHRTISPAEAVSRQPARAAQANPQGPAPTSLIERAHAATPCRARSSTRDRAARDADSRGVVERGAPGRGAPGRAARRGGCTSSTSSAVGDGVRAVLQQPEDAVPARVGEAGGHNRDIPPELGGDLRAKRRVGEAARLDDHDHIGKRGDDAPGGNEGTSAAVRRTRAGTPRRPRHAARIRWCRGSCRVRWERSGEHAITAIERPPPASAPSCAIPSGPSLTPPTTVTPARARPSVIVRVICSAYGVSPRPPTIATLGLAGESSSRRRSALHVAYNTAGALGSWQQRPRIASVVTAQRGRDPVGQRRQLQPAQDPGRILDPGSTQQPLVRETEHPQQPLLAQRRAPRERRSGRGKHR